jgi:uncharacterized protein (DUF362 family)
MSMCIYRQRKLNRRQWLQAAAGAAATVAFRPSAAKAAQAPASPVAIARCESYRTAVLRPQVEAMFDQLGGLAGLVRGKTVTVKLNMTGSPAMRFEGRPLGSTHYCHPNLVGVVCALLDGAGARRVRLVESGFATAMPLEEYMLESGWNLRAIQGAAKAVELENTNSIGKGKRYIEVSVPGGGYMFSKFLLNEAFDQTDVFVSISKLKNHATCGVTMALKNSFGITPSSIYGGDAGAEEPNESPTQGRSPLHFGDRQPSKIAPPENDPTSPRDSGYRVPRIVADLALARPIQLSIIDGIETMIGGEGPWIGRENLRFGTPKLLIAGLNPVCTDAVGTAVMGYDPRATRGTVPFRACDNTMLLAEAHGVGSADLERIEVRGLRVAEARFPFEPAPKAGVAGFAAQG